VIVALCAQGYSPADAARLGVFIHGLAGDIAAIGVRKTGVIARDIIESLPEAFDDLEEYKSYFL
jgi:ADP-dependent NAD(P)H-hydrate dehydratase / NAD(P)H-hydrate epimerase